MDLLDLSSVEDVNEDDVMEATRPLITRFSQENDNDLAYFFTEVQNKLLEELDDDDTEEYNEQHDEYKENNNTSTKNYIRGRQHQDLRGRRRCMRTAYINRTNSNRQKE